LFHKDPRNTQPYRRPFLYNTTNMPRCNQEREASKATPISLDLQKIAKDFRNQYKAIQQTYEALGLILDSLIFQKDVSNVEIEAKELEADVYVARLDEAFQRYKGNMESVDVAKFTTVLIVCGCEADAADEMVGSLLEDLDEECKYAASLLIDIKSVLEKGKQSWDAVRYHIIDSLIGSGTGD
jgi:hypothetical protein